MTISVANPSLESYEDRLKKGSSGCGSILLPRKAETTALPRFNLRKRSVKDGCEGENLPSVNSAFLSCLFADVAKVQSEEAGSPRTNPAVVECADDEARPVKKSRLSLNRSISRSISRCSKSFKNLEALQASPTGIMEVLSHTPSDVPHFPLLKTDSLQFQLKCVSQCPEEPSAISEAIFKAGELAFPHLPATVSNSSCSTLTRNLSDLQSSLAENEEKESYGWFVVMDDELRTAADPYAGADANKLAFEAPTAPNASGDQDAEVEWAKAADTVDDVLGDFF